MEAPIDRKRSRQQVPRLIKHVNTAEVNEFDVMLSYSWTTKEQVLGLCDALTEILPGIKIWVDRDEMNGNVNLAMARGILKSSVIIVCLSVAYLVGVAPISHSVELKTTSTSELVEL
ncbi:hypothetical protein BCR33DRAFT_695621 [Rhizoclosmatium globosum]|uniref:TIR domain-containing protein n=1 Tax=Rhizoclosmatium globosum TaxID=329046 RepID=A0A1Y2CPZ6_9FUNG|nr:hypothetical protein BCR33DRAFT_695621 [Rhizoclosmatium globosum]|eukprot:ORY49118.1 hypothetical protein BCR33DRAFT_695621 [Rhizoclosmatium globosum]